MNDVVVDSSVVAKWLLPEDDADLATQLMADVVAAHRKLIVLDLAFPEVANAIWKRQHRGLITAIEGEVRCGELLKVPVQVESARRILKPGFEIAQRYDRSVYDALFVALCRDLSLQGVTADAALHAAVHADFPEIVLLRNWRAAAP